MSRSINFTYYPYVTAFLQTDLVLVYLFFFERKAVQVLLRRDIKVASCDWSWHSDWSLIPGKFDPNISRSMKTP